MARHSMRSGPVMNDIAHHALPNTKIASDLALGLPEALQAVGDIEGIHVKRVTSGGNGE